MPDLGGLELDARRRAVHLDPGLGGIAGRGGLVAESRGRPCDQAKPVCPLSAQVNLDR